MSQFLTFIERSRDAAGVRVYSTLAAKALQELSKHDPDAVSQLVKEAEDHITRIRREKSNARRLSPCLRRY